MRHNALRDALVQVIQSVTNQQPLLEQLLPPPTNQATSTNKPTSNNHPDNASPTVNRADITWHTTTAPVHLDIMVTSALTQAALAGNHVMSITPGYANAQAEHHKRRKYAPHDVTPITFEAHGRFGNEALTFLRKLTNTSLEPERARAYHQAVQLFSTTLQRYNAKAIEAHIKHHIPTQHNNQPSSTATA